MTNIIDPIRQASEELAPSFGRCLSVRGSQAEIGLPAASVDDADETRVTVGKFIGIRAGKSMLVGVVTDVRLQTQTMASEHGYAALAHLDLVGEIFDHGTPQARF